MACMPPRRFAQLFYLLLPLLGTPCGVAAQALAPAQAAPMAPAGLSPWRLGEPHGAWAGLARSQADLESDTPPLSSFDALPEPSRLTRAWVGPEDHALVSQVGRTLLALGFVIALIYLLAKVLLPRLARSLGDNGGRRLKILERTSLDAKHALVLVEVDGGVRLLVGTGDAGVQLIAELSRPSEHSFARSLAQTSKSAGVSPEQVTGSGAPGGQHAEIN